MLLAILAALPVVLGAQQCPAMLEPGVEPALACFVDRTPACPDRRHCVALHVHVVVGPEGPVQTPVWLAAQLEHAFRLFEPVDVGFQVESVDSVDASFARMATREQRDAIGRSRFSRGVVHLFVVAQLDDVDAPGEQIRGVHWRQRSNTDKRWVIVSAIAQSTVLAHELGHFFGLPHSSYRRSIMNKTPREDPPWEARVFVDEELAIVRAERDRMFTDSSLVEREPDTRAGSAE
ncbi:matrixin family metalloprotease [Nannocystaceae bacterium ST9]